MIIVATAAWSVPTAAAPRVGRGASGLTRYARVFDGTEINSSFYRSHRPQTFRRWADEVPEHFRFAAKLPRAITHEARLAGAKAQLADFLGQVGELGPKLGPLLVQLPPSLAFDPDRSERFLIDLRRGFAGHIAWEPRHASWFGAEAQALLRRYRVARVAADPPLHPGGGDPGGFPGLAYVRLHGSPSVYYSSYEDTFLDDLVARLRQGTAEETWCVFDNTASGAAFWNALAVKDRLDPGRASGHDEGRRQRGGGLRPPPYAPTGVKDPNPLG